VRECRKNILRSNAIAVITSRAICNVLNEALINSVQVTLARSTLISIGIEHRRLNHEKHSLKVAAWL
jgi:hypothetical protein